MHCLIFLCFFSISIESALIPHYIAGEWVGNGNCSDPHKQYESVVHKLEDLVSTFQYQYFDDSAEKYEEEPKLPNKLWFKTDSRKLGRCYTTIPTIEHIQLGIQKIVLGVKPIVRVRDVYGDEQGPIAQVFFHTPEMFLTGRLLQQYEIYPKTLYHLDVNHEIYNTLENVGKKNACSMDPNYSKDNCANREVERESIEEFGCTSPFGINKTKICQNTDAIAKVKEIYTDKIEKHNSTCLNPCSFFPIMTLKTKEKRIPCSFCKSQGSQVEITFKGYIKVSTSYYLYSGLSLIAEVGGYVGLFLGVSINQIADLFEWSLTKMNFL